MSATARMVHLATGVLAVLVFLGASRPLPVSAADAPLFVSQGKPWSVCEAGNPMAQGRSCPTGA